MSAYKPTKYILVRNILCLHTPFLSRALLLCGWVMQKDVLGLMQTVKAQITLHIQAVCSLQSLSANRNIGYYRMYE